MGLDSGGFIEGIFMRPWTLVTVLVTAMLAGCYGQVVTSQARDAPNGDVKIAVVYRAKPGTKFTDVAEKQVNVTVSVAGRSSSQPPIYLFSREYRITVADLGWSIEWIGPERGKVEFFSYPPGISSSIDYGTGNRTATTPVATLEVARKVASDEFELVAENWSVSHTTKIYPASTAR